MTQLDATLQPHLDRLQRQSLLVGVVALALCGLGAALHTDQFFRSYLFGFLFWFGIALGCLAWMMLHHLVAGGWGFVLQRLLEAGARTLPVVLVLFLPLFFGMKQLYLWARPEVVSGDALLQHKSLYLNVPFFWVRALGYFALWLLFAYLLNRWSLQQDRTGDPALTRRIEEYSGPGLVMFVLTASFASFDWVMSLEPHWFSTIFGVLFIVGQGLATLAFAVIVVSRLVKYPPLAGVIKPQHFHDLGNLMFAFVMLWAYISFSQFLIIWSGNLPEEIPWYLHRLHGGWGVLAVILLVFHFALPFVLLLMRRIKRDTGALTRVAAAMFVLRLLDLFWIVAPNFHPEALYLHWMDVLAPLGIGGLWFAAFLRQLRSRPLLPLHDPRLQEAFHQHA